MKHLKYLQMWFSQMFQGGEKKNPHKPSFEAAAIEWVRLHKEERRKGKLYTQLNFIPGAGDWWHNLSCSSVDEFGHAEGV